MTPMMYGIVPSHLALLVLTVVVDAIYSGVHDLNRRPIVMVIDLP